MILLLGSTGFTGKYVLKELKKRRIAVRCFIRPESKQTSITPYADEIFVGSIHQPEDWHQALAGVKGVINLVSFKEGHVPLLLKQMEIGGVKRILLISTTAIFTSLNVKSKIMRQQIEQQITQSPLEWTIIRPTMIYGTADDRNMVRLIRAVKRFSIHPLPGGGEKMIQPIYVKDIARAIVDAFLSPKTIQRSYNVSGKESLTYKNCVQLIANVLGKRIFLVTLPLKIAVFLAWLLYPIPGLPKIKKEQLLRLNEDKSFSHEDAARDFGFSPTTFSLGIKEEIQEIFSLNQ